MKGQGKGLHLWGTDGGFDSFAGFSQSSPSLFHIEDGAKSADCIPRHVLPTVLLARSPISTHNSFAFLAKHSEDDNAEDAIPSVSDINWPHLTTETTQKRRNCQSVSKRPSKKKTNVQCCYLRERRWCCREQNDW